MKNLAQQRRYFWLLICILLAGCSPKTARPLPAPQTTQTAATILATRTPEISLSSPTETLTPFAESTQKIETGAAPLTRIGVRVVNGTGEFYDRETGEKFIPRGFNYVRLAPMGSTSGNLWHSTLNPGFYDSERAAAALSEMHASGFNVVRVFVDCCRKGSNAGSPSGGISTPYLDNVIEFLEIAAENEIYVLLILDLTPAEGGYDELWMQCCTNFDGENLRYLTAGGHRAETRFNQDFIRALIARTAPLESIFAIDLTNEVHFSVDLPPFSLTRGKVRTANGEVYDMASQEEKTRMMDENLVYWIDTQRAAIQEIAPGMLVTVSFPAINSGQTSVHTGPAIMESKADFIDLHAYLGWGLNLSQYMARFEVAGDGEKPIILGEFGIDIKGAFTAGEAARQLIEMQVESCDFGIDGWLMWTWDSDEQNSLWNAMSEDGVIRDALAPADRPNPCEL